MNILGMLCYIIKYCSVFIRNFVMTRIIYFATVTTDDMV